MTSDETGEWRLSTLGVACEINPSRPKLTASPDNTPVMFVPMAAVDEVTGVVSKHESRMLGDVRAKSYRSFAPGDVLFAKITPCMENGKSAIVPDISNGLGFGSTEFHVLRPRADVNPRFIWHFIRQESFRKLAEGQMSGSVGQLRVPVAFLRDFPLPLPNKEMQNGIAKALDFATEKGQSAIVHLSAARREMDRFRRSVLAAACSGRLTADWREAHPDATTAEEALGAAQSTRLRGRRDEHSVDLEIPELPASYALATLGEACLALEYGTSKRCEAGPDELPVLRMGNIQKGELDWSDLKFASGDDELERLMLQDGDLLFNRTNSPELVGKTAVFHGERPASFASYLIRVRFAKEIAHADFVHYWISSAAGRAWARAVKTDGVSQSNINGTKLAMMPLPLPPIDEQHEIVRRVKSLLRVAEEVLSRMQDASRRIERSSQAVLAKAFRGELVPQ